MATTLLKRRLDEAIEDAEAFRALFPANSYAQWAIAGSVRRRANAVADIEHVVVPLHGNVPGDDLFAQPVRANLLWHAMDAIVATGQLTKHLYGTAQSTRYGEKYRGVDFRGFNHEIFTADPMSWGAQLAIRTGPADLSKSLVTGLLRNGRRAKDGFVWSCVRCPDADTHPHGPSCPKCDGTTLKPDLKLEILTEAEFFELCGQRYIVPERR